MQVKSSEVKSLTVPPQLFIGAVANPFADPFKYRAARLATKVDAGAEFIQTQCIFNLNRFKEWMGLVKDYGMDNKVYILGGITPLKSARMAEYMAKHVAGMDVPEEIINRMKAVPAKEQRQEGIKIAVETIQALQADGRCSRGSYHGNRMGRRCSADRARGETFPKASGLRGVSDMPPKYHIHTAQVAEPISVDHPVGSHCMGRRVPQMRPLRKEGLRLQGI